MGMFDYVNYRTLCKNCKEVIDEFQSKDGPCTLSTVEPYEVKRFYGSCPKCKMWHQFKVMLNPPTPPYAVYWIPFDKEDEDKIDHIHR